jgi:hypothetical protein
VTLCTYCGKHPAFVDPNVRPVMTPTEALHAAACQARRYFVRVEEPDYDIDWDDL